MAKIKVTKAFRLLLAEKLMDLGNFITVALVLGQFLPGVKFSLHLLFVGVAGTLICYFASYVLSS